MGSTSISKKLKKAEDLINNLIKDYEKLPVKPRRIAAWTHIIIGNSEHFFKIQLGSYEVPGTTTKISFKLKDFKRVQPMLDLV